MGWSRLWRKRDSLPLTCMRMGGGLPGVGNAPAKVSHQQQLSHTLHAKMQAGMHSPCVPVLNWRPPYPTLRTVTGPTLFQSLLLSAGRWTQSIQRVPATAVLAMRTRPHQPCSPASALQKATRAHLPPFLRGTGLISRDPAGTGPPLTECRPLLFPRPAGPSGHPSRRQHRHPQRLSPGSLQSVHSRRRLCHLLLPLHRPVLGPAAGFSRTDYPKSPRVVVCRSCKLRITLQNSVNKGCRRWQPMLYASS